MIRIGGFRGEYSIPPVQKIPEMDGFNPNRPKPPEVRVDEAEISQAAQELDAAITEFNELQSQISDLNIATDLKLKLKQRRDDLDKKIRSLRNKIQ